MSGIYNKLKMYPLFNPVIISVEKYVNEVVHNTYNRIEKLVEKYLYLMGNECK